MKCSKYAVGLLAVGLATASASATISANLTLDFSLPGVVQHIWTVDTDSDFTAAVYLAELSSGSVHNPFTVDETIDMALLGLPGDTFVTANGNPDTKVNGPAIALGGLGPFPGFGPDVISVTWSSPGADTDRPIQLQRRCHRRLGSTRYQCRGGSNTAQWSHPRARVAWPDRLRRPRPAAFRQEG